MSIILFIIYLNSLVWLIVPIRQFGTKYFLFFLILGLLDPIFILSFYIFKISVEPIFLMGTGLLTYGVFVNLSNANRLITTGTMLVVCILSAVFVRDYYLHIILFIHLIIFFCFLTIILKEFSDKRVLKYFYILLITYEVSLLVKFYLTIYFHEIAAADFHFTSIFQILIGIAFLFNNEKNSKAIKFI